MIRSLSLGVPKFRPLAWLYHSAVNAICHQRLRNLPPEWPAVAVQFNRSRDNDYFDVPRGRVLLERKTGHGVIYHGNETGAATLRQIARAFNLDNWRAEIDEHYLMGAEADRLFEE